jgi:hypothetical protein
MYFSLNSLSLFQFKLQAKQQQLLYQRNLLLLAVSSHSISTLLLQMMQSLQHSNVQALHP